MYLPSGGYSRQNGASALGAFKTGQVHFVHEAVHILSSSSASNSTRTYYIPLIKGSYLLIRGHHLSTFNRARKGRCKCEVYVMVQYIYNLQMSSFQALRPVFTPEKASPVSSQTLLRSEK
jgi:hypothetical protein